jgi:hypothetical protein
MSNPVVRDELTGMDDLDPPSAARTSTGRPISFIGHRVTVRAEGQFVRPLRAVIRPIVGRNDGSGANRPVINKTLVTFVVIAVPHV